MIISFAAVEPLPTNTEQYEHLKKELEKLRAENERLQRRKNELELFVEQTNLKDAYDIRPEAKEYKVMG